MSFWEKIKQSLRNFMSGRNGADRLGLTLLWVGLILYILGTLIGTASGTFWLLLGSLLNLAGFACYVLCIFRMFSRNLTKRQAENRRFEASYARIRTQLRQAKNRFKNRKQYKYFRCPSCKAWLRLPRGKGVVTVTCSRCHTSFTQKS